MLVAILALAALLRVGIIGRSSLWADELFSLAIATGHSLEHPAAIANPKLGDFVQTDGAVGQEEFRRYLRHDNPPAGPARVLRAVLLSDTSPPLYYLLLYGWTLLLGTSDVSIRMQCKIAGARGEAQARRFISEKQLKPIGPTILGESEHQTRGISHSEAAGGLLSA